MLYKKLEINSFEVIRLELLNSFVNQNSRYWDLQWSNFQDLSPSLYDFINQRKKILVRLCRFYLTPAFGILKPHIDGFSNNKSPIGLNIPIYGFENTKMIWYDNPNDNFEDGNFGFNQSTASRIRDFNLLKKIDETVIDVPTLVRTDVVHGIINPNPVPRLVLSIRFFYTQTFGQEFDQVMNLDGL